MFPIFDKENDIGNIEYKLIINKKKKINLITQFLFRLREGNGKCFYIIGIDNNGYAHFKNIKIILKNTLTFINFTKTLSNFKIKLFINNGYIFSIISFYNSNYNNFNIFDFNLLS